MQDVLKRFDLSGQVAIVTGGCRGIGFAIAEGVASAGATVVIADILEERGQCAAAALVSEGLKARFIPVDVTSRKSVERLVSKTMAESNRIDILVNAAGIVLRKPIEAVTDNEWNGLFSVNLHGVFLCSQTAGIEMIRRKQGKIVNLSSVVSRVTQPEQGLYGVTKAGVSYLTKVMAAEWAPHHVYVNAIAPGPTVTEINRTYFEDHPEILKDRLRSILLGRMGDPQDYVGAALLLASKASDFMTGQTLFVDGGYCLT
jgi:NAD(P)-dependent dehydrogenase (short-subunit alcohol dehydrogenase family)